MVKASSMLNDYRASGAFHRMVNIEAAIDTDIFVTKTGGIAMFVQVPGIDPYCLEAARVDATTRGFEAAIKGFNERFRFYQYFMKRPYTSLQSRADPHPIVQEASQGRIRFLKKSGRLYDVDTFFAVVLENWRNEQVGRDLEWLKHPLSSLRGRLSPKASAEDLSLQVKEACELLRNRVQSCLLQLRDISGARILNDQEAFGLVRRLLNYDPEISDPIRLKSSDLIDVQACSSTLECHADHLRLGKHYIAVLTLQEPPGRTFAQMLEELIAIDAPMIIASEWKRADTAMIEARNHLRIHKWGRNGLAFQKETSMKRILPVFSGNRRRTAAPLFAMLLAGASSARAASPWEDAVNALQVAFTGPIARGLSLVAIVVGGLMFAFGEGDSKRTLAGIVFGVGMAIGAVNFVAWLFPNA